MDKLTRGPRRAILDALHQARIEHDLAKVLIERVGVESREDLELLSQLEPEFLLRTVLQPGEMTPLQAIRVCKRLRRLRTMVPTAIARDSGCLARNVLVDQFGAVDVGDLAGNPSNRLLVDTLAKELYIPTYPSVAIKRLRTLNEFERSASWTLALLLRFDFCGLPPKLNESLVESLILHINDTSLAIKDTEHEVRFIDPEQRSVLMLTSRVTLHNCLFTDPGGSSGADFVHYKDFPFDTTELHLRLDVKPVTVYKGRIFQDIDVDEEDMGLARILHLWKIRFNLHRFVHYTTSDEFAHLPANACAYLNKNVQLKILDLANKLPNFEILRNLASVDLQPEARAKPYYTPRIKLTIPIFRHPGAALRSMVFPLLSLNLGTLATLFMAANGSNYNDRLTNLITLMVALFAFLGYARRMVPEVPTSTWIDRTVLRSCMMAMAAMVDSLYSTLTSHDGEGGEGPSQRGGAFRYIWNRRETGKNIVRLVGIGVPILCISIHTAASLYLSYWRYSRILLANRIIVEFLGNSEESLGGREKFSRQQYVHPMVATHDDEKNGGRSTEGLAETLLSNSALLPCPQQAKVAKRKRLRWLRLRWRPKQKIEPIRCEGTKCTTLSEPNLAKTRRDSLGSRTLSGTVVARRESLGDQLRLVHSHVPSVAAKNPTENAEQDVAPAANARRPTLHTKDDIADLRKKRASGDTDEEEGDKVSSLNYPPRRPVRSPEQRRKFTYSLGDHPVWDHDDEDD